jgi:hypothetical protein
MKMQRIKFLLLMLLFTPSLMLAAPYAYPVPFVERQHASQGITFKNLPASGTIKVLTVVGEEVLKMDIPTGAGTATWIPVNNSSGKQVATGVYFYIIESSSDKTIGKLVIIR